MRLIQLADFWGPHGGSFVPMVRAAAAEARDRGWSVAAGFTGARGPDFLRDLERDGISVHVAGPQVRGTRGLARWVRTLLAEGTPAILHTHFFKLDLPAALAAGAHGRTAVLWHLHNPSKPGVVPLARTLVKYGLVGRALPVTDILCVGSHLADQARHRLAPPGHVHWLPNGIDTARFAPAGLGERAAAREALGLPEDAIVLMHFGWDWSRKGGDLYLRAVKALADRGLRLVAASVKGGEPARSLAAELDLEDSLRLLDECADARQLYLAADVFCTPSRSEGSPFALIEALCMRVPAVATDLPGQAFLGAAGPACAIVPQEDPEAVADAVAHHLNRPARNLADDLDAARSWVLAECDLSAWSDRLGRVYDDAATSL